MDKVNFRTYLKNYPDKDGKFSPYGGGSNAAGMFTAFSDEPVELCGVEPLGRGHKLGDHAASITYGEKGIMHGFESIILFAKMLYKISNSHNYFSFAQ